MPRSAGAGGIFLEPPAPARDSSFGEQLDVTAVATAIIEDRRRRVDEPVAQRAFHRQREVRSADGGPVSMDLHHRYPRAEKRISRPGPRRWAQRFA
jgi:hypothetical protein